MTFKSAVVGVNQAAENTVEAELVGTGQNDRKTGRSSIMASISNKNFYLFSCFFFRTTLQKKNF